MSAEDRAALDKRIDGTMLCGHVIDGKIAVDNAQSTIQEWDPSSGSPSFLIARGTSSDIDRAVASAKSAQGDWAALRPIARGRVLNRIASGLRDNRLLLARIDQRETGRSMSQCLGEVEGTAQYFEYYGGLVNANGGRTIDLGDGYHSYTRHEPYGVVGVITPWNTPLTQVGRAVAPALAVGNAVVLKPSEFTSVAAVMLALLAHNEWGLPEGLLNVVTGMGIEAGAALVEHLDVKKIAFTGSLRAGKEIGKVAAERIIPVSLELGGKSANIIFADAEVDRALESAVGAFSSNAGQVCSGGTRILVESSLYGEFVNKLSDRIKRNTIAGDSAAASGPIITNEQFKRVKGYLDLAKEEGLDVHIGGGMDEVNPQGWYLPATVIAGIDNNHRLAKEEIFGPVVVVISFENEDEAIRIANDSEYGLVAGVWTSDLARAHKIAAQLEVGQVFVNEYFAGGVETPFGGYKMSGLGREKGLEALDHYCQVKSVTVRL